MKKCINCSGIILYKSFNTPKQYLECLDNIKCLLETGAFEFISGTPVDKVKDINGCWIDDIISHTVRCKDCDKCFTCVIDTYHGRGSFQKDN